MGLSYYGLNQSACVSLLNIAEASCIDESCSTGDDKKMATEEEWSMTGESSTRLDTKIPRDDWIWVDKKKKREREKRSDDERVSPLSHPHIPPEPPLPLEGMDDSSIPYSRGIER